ncbi:MAG TPA: YSC84-related protein [Hyphomicrobiaceae bacterium]|nr:YSC84-related protein [Hyphomicrobiaceae bacterium]
MNAMHRIASRRTILSLAVALLAAMAAAPQSKAASAQDIEAGVDATLNRFYREVGGAYDLAQRAAGILVFPSVIKAGFGVGGEYGEGALRIRGRTASYYNTVSASIGFQLGAQSRSVIIMFMTEGALARFNRTDGWKIGVDAGVTLVTVGASGSIDTNKINSPVIGFILGETGLMYNLTLEGSKISRIYR